MRLLMLAVLACLLLAPHPARAGEAHDILFGGGNEWLNTARPLTQDDAKGRVILLDFWTYGCINCMQIVPDLKKLESEFGDRLLVIGVHSAKFSGEKGSARILAAARRFGITHPVINDSSYAVWKAFKVRAWPTQVLVDMQGRAVAAYSGEGHYDKIRADVARLLKATPSAPALPLAALEAKSADSGVLSFPARLGYAQGTPWGNLLFIADGGHHRIVGATPEGAIKITIGGGKEGAQDGAFGDASFSNPRGFALVKDGIYIADTGNHKLRFADFKTQKVTTVAGTGKRGYDRSVKDGNARATSLASPWDVEMLPDGRTLAVAMAGLHQLWVYDTQEKTVSVLAGSGKEAVDDGAAGAATLAQPSGLSLLDGALYFADAESSALRVLKNGQVKTLVGTGLFDFGLVDGTYPAARLQHPQGLHAEEGRIVIADTYNNTLRIYDLKTGVLSTLKVAGKLAEPGDVLRLKGKLYVADTNNHHIAVIDEKTGETTDLPLGAP